MISRVMLMKFLVMVDFWLRFIWCWGCFVVTVTLGVGLFCVELGWASRDGLGYDLLWFMLEPWLQVSRITCIIDSCIFFILDIWHLYIFYSWYLIFVYFLFLYIFNSWYLTFVFLILYYQVFMLLLCIIRFLIVI